jgi:hypothetical protein
MRRHDTYIGLIRSTVFVVAIGFVWSSFALAEEPTSPPAPSDQSVQRDGGNAGGRAALRFSRDEGGCKPPNVIVNGRCVPPKKGGQ